MPERDSLVNWALFAALTVLWASAFGFTKLAVETLPPQLIIPLRLTLAAVVLNLVLAASGRRLPPLRDRRIWPYLAVMGVVGMTMPFLFITIGQRTVPSNLAALYIATAPIFTALAAQLVFPDEKLTLRGGLGVALGFLGVAALMTPSFEGGQGGLLPQALCVLAALGYAVANLMAKGAPPMPPLVFSAGYVGIAALTSWPLALGVEWDGLAPSAASIAGVVGLGLGATGLAPICHVILVRRTGATFVALTGYTIPIVSGVIGYLAFGETLGWNALLAFALILSGVWLAQTRAASKAAREKRPGTHV